MTDGPQQCALPECHEVVEQPDDGGPRRLYCSPAHRAAARKMRHAARMDSTATQPTSIGSGATQPAEQQDESTAAEPPAALAAPRPEPDPGQAPEHEWSPAAAWTITPPALPPAPKERTVRTITSKRVKKQRPVRTAADLKNAASAMRRRAVASVAIASLVAGGASYMVTENIIPTPTTLPPRAAPQPSMEADVWAGQAEVVLASLSSQLDAVVQAEAAWLGLPEDRRAQEPDAVQALKDRKALLEQRRATLMSQLEALRALPDRTTELTSAQAQLDAVERTLRESTSTAASPDYQEALRQLEEQREMRRQQRDHAAQALADLRSGVEEALSAPLPADKDTNDTTKVVERVKAVVEGRPDPGDQDDDPEHDAGDGQDPASNQRREDEGEERDDTGTTAPPDPERPSVPDVLAGGAGELASDGGGTSPDPGSGNSDTDPASSDPAPTDNSPADNSPADETERPVGPIANPLGGLLGGTDSDRSESDEQSSRDDDNDDDRGNSWFDRGGDDNDNDDRGNTSAGDDDNDDRGNSWFDRGGDNDNDDRGNTSAGDDDNDDRGNSWFDRGNNDDANEGDRDRGGLDDLTDGLIGDDRGDDTDEGGNANWDDRDEGDDRAAEEDDDRGGLDDVTDGLIGDDRNESAEERDTEDRNAQDDDAAHDDAEQAGGEDRAGGDEERKRPVGKAERERQRAEENNESSSEASDQDEGDEDSTSDDRGDEDRGENADDNNDRGAGDDEDAGEDDDKGDDDGDKGDDDGDKGDDDGDKGDDDGDKGDDDDKDDDDGDKGDDDGDKGDDDDGDSDSGDGGDDDGGDGGGDDGGSDGGSDSGGDDD
jgi:hypothetical protein